MQADPTEPIDIRYANARECLEIDWADGVTVTYRYEFLRWKCPCAECSGEMGAPGRMQFITALAPTQYALADIQVVGNYALRPTWQDGHDTGIFPFALLRRLAPSAAQYVLTTGDTVGPRGRP